jgi:apolipoprotein D and lipocalin family protein
MNMLLGLLLIAGMSFAQPGICDEVQAVSQVHLQRYIGQWFEIARFPQRHQENCDQAEAHYQIGESGKVIVENKCIDSKDGSLRKVQGIAEVVDTKSNAKLKVSFVPGWMRWTGIGRGDYWIIDLAPDYSYAVVSEPQRKYLWILSRTPTMKLATFDTIKAKLVAMGFDLSRLIPARENHLE